MVVTHRRARPARSTSLRRRLPIPHALTILVVNDDPGLRELISARLAHAGYEVTTAANGWAALDEATERRPDLVVLDVVMPGLSGPEVCRRLRRRPDTSDVPAILLGTSPNDEFAREGAAAGANRYLTKPLGLRSLVDEVAALLPWPDQAA